MAFQRPSGLILPSNVAYVREEVYFCAVCSPERIDRDEPPLGFTREEARKYERHVIECAARNEGALLERSLREKAPAIFGQEGWDEEMEQWVRDNKRALLEDRKKL